MEFESETFRTVVSNIIGEAPETPRGKDLKVMGQKLLAESTDVLSRELSGAMNDIIIKASSMYSNSGPNMREVVWRDFHQLRQVKLLEIWGSLLPLCEIRTRDQLFEQSINQKLFESLLSAHLSRNAAESQPSASISVTLSTDELNVLRYIGGYIFMKIRMKYDQKVDEVSHQFVCCIVESIMEEGDDIDSEDVLSYTREWISATNRGGLIPINDGAFLFFVELQKAVQSVLPKHMTNV